MALCMRVVLSLCNSREEESSRKHVSRRDMKDDYDKHRLAVPHLWAI